MISSCMRPRQTRYGFLERSWYVILSVVCNMSSHAFHLRKQHYCLNLAHVTMWAHEAGGHTRRSVESDNVQPGNPSGPYYYCCTILHCTDRSRIARGERTRMRDRSIIPVMASPVWTDLYKCFSKIWVTVAAYVSSWVQIWNGDFLSYQRFQTLRVGPLCSSRVVLSGVVPRQDETI